MAKFVIAFFDGDEDTVAIEIRGPVGLTAMDIDIVDVSNEKPLRGLDARDLEGVTISCAASGLSFSISRDQAVELLAGLEELFDGEGEPTPSQPERVVQSCCTRRASPHFFQSSNLARGAW